MQSNGRWNNGPDIHVPTNVEDMCGVLVTELQVSQDMGSEAQTQSLLQLQAMV